MKTKLYFTSNSSSSSFICDVCQEQFSGMDASYSDFELSYCERGHVFCNSHARTMESPLPSELRAMLINKANSWAFNGKDEYVKKIQDAADEDLDDYVKEYFEDGLPPCYCPICSMVKVTDEDLLLYLITKSGLTKKELVDEILMKFSSYEEFEKYNEQNKKQK